MANFSSLFSRKPQILLLAAMTRQRLQRARWSIFPAMHADVSRLLEVENLHFTFYVDSIQGYDTNVRRDSGSG
jgi:hypothetical protein